MARIHYDKKSNRHELVANDGIISNQQLLIFLKKGKDALYGRPPLRFRSHSRLVVPPPLQDLIRRRRLKGERLSQSFEFFIRALKFFLNPFSSRSSKLQGRVVGTAEGARGLRSPMRRRAGGVLRQRRGMRPLDDSSSSRRGRSELAVGRAPALSGTCANARVAGRGAHG